MMLKVLIHSLFRIRWSRYGYFSKWIRRILEAHFTKYIHFSEGIRRILAAQLTGMAHDCSQQLLRLCISQQSHYYVPPISFTTCSAVCIICLLPKIRWKCLKSMKFGRKSVDFLKSTEFGGKLRNSEELKTLLGRMPWKLWAWAPTRNREQCC